MSIDIETIKGYLDDEELVYAVFEGRPDIVVPFGTQNVLVEITEDGGAVRFRAPQVFNLEGTPHMLECLKWMANHTYGRKIGHFGFDPRDGEVDCCFVFPVEDGEMTQRQFMRSLQTVRHEACVSVEELRQVAFGKTPEAPESGLSGEFARMLEQLRGLAPEARFDVDSLPAAPVDEGQWLSAVADALNALCSPLMLGEGELTTLRETVWPRIQALREESTAAGQRYITVETAHALGLSREDELVVLFMLARQKLGDLRIDTKEIDFVYSPGQDVPETIGVIQRLADADVICSSDGDGVAPYRLTEGFLCRLADVLPFDWAPPPPPMDVAELPSAPVTEAEWLDQVRRAVDSVGPPDAAAPSRLDHLRDEIWPVLLELRAGSEAAGHNYRTSALAGDMGVKPNEELVILTLSRVGELDQAAIGPAPIDLLLSPGIQARETLGTIARLADKGLLAYRDNDGLAPYTVGAKARELLGGTAETI